jgi:F0F1-type ATP synthase assembly protein I
MENTKNQNMQNNSRQTIKNTWVAAFALGTEMGFMIAIPLVVFVAGGVFLDKKLGTLPLFLIIGILLNLAVTIVGTKKLILPFLEKRSQNKTDNNKNNN